MKIDVKSADARSHPCGALVVFAYEGIELYYGLQKPAEEANFKGKLFDAKMMRAPSGFAAKNIILAGLGKRENATDYSLFGAAGKAAQLANEAELESIAFVLPEGAGTRMQNAARALCEGVLYALYSFDEFKSKGKEKEKKLELAELLASTGDDAHHMKKAAAEAQVLMESVNFTRTLVNYPSNLKRPPELAERIRKKLVPEGVHVRIFDERALKQMGMTSILGVGQGSASPPRLAVLEYGKKGDGKTLCLVGKGITFDSGGISLKPGKGMDEMKDDMAGAAAVAGAISAIARLRLPVHVVGVLAFAENMPSGTAQRPGDIVRAMNGKTIEVLNTDAEGRLVLADALVYAEKTFKPDYIVDIATLTGAVQVALGKHAIGLLGNNEKLIASVMEAGEAVHERCWQLPLWDDYKEMVKGKFADVKNIGSEGGEAGTITAAAFLASFVTDNAKWAHLDIAATAYGDVSKPFVRTGASGVGVRLFVELAKRLA